MDFEKLIPQGIENREEIIKNLKLEVGKEFVSRKDFNEKNEALKEANKQIGEMTTNLEGLSKEKESHEKTVLDLTSKVTGYETASLRTKIALQHGLPYDIAGRLVGEDEKSITEDAKKMAEYFGKKEPAPPLKSVEPNVSAGKDGAYKSLLENLNLEGD